MNSTTRGNMLNGVDKTDGFGFSKFVKINSNTKYPVIIIEGDYPSGVTFEVYFKAQDTEPTLCYYDYDASTPVTINKNGKIALNRFPCDSEIGVKAISGGEEQPERVYPNFYIGIY